MWTTLNLTLFLFQSCISLQPFTFKLGPYLILTWFLDLFVFLAELSCYLRTFFLFNHLFHLVTFYLIDNQPYWFLTLLPFILIFFHSIVLSFWPWYFRPSYSRPYFSTYFSFDFIFSGPFWPYWFRRYCFWPYFLT